MQNFEYARHPKYIVHVNQAHIRANVKAKNVAVCNLPPYTIKCRQDETSQYKTVYAWNYQFRGTQQGENHMFDPLSCGARVYLTCLEGEMTFFDEQGKIFEGITFAELKVRKDVLDDARYLADITNPANLAVAA